MIYNVKDHLPAWLYKDVNGKAVAMAIQAGMRKLNEIVETGRKLISDVSTAPEWRLDELAWELDCPYDLAADVETKRKWIQLAYSTARILGTKAAMEEWLQAYDDSLYVEAWHEYGGEPYYYTIKSTTYADPTEWPADLTAWVDKVAAYTASARDVVEYIVPGIGG